MISSNVVFLILGAFLGVFTLLALSVLKTISKQLKSRYDNNKMFKEEHKKVENFKKNGGLHKWIKIPVMDPHSGKIAEMHVCELTGYCPTIEGFIPLSEIKRVQTARKNEEEYQTFKKQETEAIRQYYGIEKEDIEGLVERVLSLKKNFSIKKMNEFREELKAKFGQDVEILSDIDKISEESWKH